MNFIKSLFICIVVFSMLISNSIIFAQSQNSNSNQSTSNKSHHGNDDHDDDDDHHHDNGHHNNCEGNGVWKLKGNKLKCPDQYFGTKSYDDLIFKTNALERFRISKDGNFIFAPNLSLIFPNGASFDSVGTHKLFTSYLQVGGLSGTGTALLKVTSTGKITRFPLTNNSNHYLKGDGTFGLGAFSVSGNTVYSNNAGFVGIGTSTPQEKLHVAGNIKFDGNLMNSIIHSDKTTGEVSIDGNLVTETAQVKGLLKVGTATLELDGSFNSSGSAPLNTIRTTSGPLQIQEGSTENTLFNNNVSIGTNTFDSKLTVYNSSETQPVLSVIKNACFAFPFGQCGGNIFEVKKLRPIPGGLPGEASIQTVFAVTDTGTTGVFGSLCVGGLAPSANLHVVTQVPGFGVPNIPAFMIEANNMGDALVIKDENSERTLSIQSNGEIITKGKITASEVEVVVGPIPDYVFDKGYDLMGLDSLKTYIEKNKHLPNVKSAKEIADNGNKVSIGEMQLKLLEKVEELTLYLLDLKAENEELKKLIQAK